MTKPKLKARNSNPLQPLSQPIPNATMPQCSSCVELIFTDQPNLIIDFGVHPYLNSNCHHQITYC